MEYMFNIFYYKEYLNIYFTNVFKIVKIKLNYEYIIDFILFV